LALEGPDGLRDLESGITLPSIVLLSEFESGIFFKPFKMVKIS
jgi:hypothetical protein